ncbi:MAG: cupin domain-containing protein [Beijerinckiaceae bacterium]
MNNNNENDKLNFFDSIAVVRLAHEASDDGLSAIENRLPHGYATPLHVHVSEDEVFHVLRGRIRFEVGGKTILARAGAIMNAPKGVPHRFIVESEEGADVLIITARGDFERFVREVSTPWIGEALPTQMPPPPADIERLAQAAERHGITIMGPPLALHEEGRIAA